MTESVGFLIDDAARLYRREFNARMRFTGVTALQWRLLMWLRRCEGITQAALADILEVEPITVSRMLDRLVESGLVEKRLDPLDRRARQLFLTARAVDLLSGAQTSLREQARDATDGLTSAESEALMMLLDRVRSNLSRKTAARDAEPL